MILFVCGLVALALLYPVNPGLREPAYGGRPLSKWIDAYSYRSLDGPEGDQAAQAVRQIGTNALPVLLKWIDDEPTPFRKNLAASRAGEIIGSFLGLRQPPKVSRADYGFKILGPSAKPAIPQLFKFINDTNAPERALNSLSALLPLGIDALPPMAQLLTNTNHHLHHIAAGYAASMAYLGRDAEPLVPLLVNCTKEPNPDTVRDAICTLGWLAIQPETSVPVLTNFLTHPNPQFRYQAILAISKFGRPSPPTVSILRWISNNDPIPWVSSKADDALYALSLAPWSRTNAQPP